jgi:hypothetical protein
MTPVHGGWQAESLSKLTIMTPESQTKKAKHLYTENAKNLDSKFFDSVEDKFAIMTCISQKENAKNLDSKFIDPILAEMLLINFQPFYDFVVTESKEQNKDDTACYTFNFTSWDRRLFNTLHVNRSFGNV